MPSLCGRKARRNYAHSNNISYKIASKEKAICDLLYSKYPVRSISDLKTLLFEDLRIDEDEFQTLNFKLYIFKSHNRLILYFL